MKILKEKRNLIVLLVLLTIGAFLFLNIKPKIKTDTEFLVSAGVVPHHLLAKEIIEKFFSYLSSKGKPEIIVLLGPDHFDGGDIHQSTFITLDPETKEWRGMKIDGALIKNLSSKINFVFSNSTLNFDHGITNLIPFLKKYFPESKIVPFIVPFNISKEKTEEFVISLNNLTPQNTILIASTDFSHYLPVLAAKFHDRKSIRTLINFERENFENLEVESWQGLYIARMFAKLRKKEFPKIIAWANSNDFVKNFNTEKTTSYFSLVFEKGREKIKESKGKTVLFVGDIMLDRGVEYLIQKNNLFYPFEKINQFLKGVDILVGNLEGTIVENPPNFGAHSLRFAFSSEVVRALSFANFNLFSLANNHTLDMGKIGLEKTKEFLTKAKIDFVGHPIECDKDFKFEKDEIIILAFNKTFPFNCSDEKILELIKEIKDLNPQKFLIIFFHWGEEYQLKSSLSQRNLAHRAIDAGADLIIGSHPHVVQEIEEYKGRLIFYSLGNFVFDQYFSKETQEGLALGIEVFPEKVIYYLFPIQSHLSQPFLMEEEKAKEFLEKLAKKNFPHLTNKIKEALIEIER